MGGGIHFCATCTKNELSISQGGDWTESPKVYGIKALPCMESNFVCMESPKVYGIKALPCMESNSVCMESPKVYGIKPPLAFPLDFF